MSDFVPCTLKALPEHLAAAAGLVPGHLSLLRSKYWSNRGVKLTVGFMESTPADLAARLLTHFNSWGEFCNVSFALSQTDPQVRITRAGNGYWSYLGTDILHIPRNEPTMCLQAFTMQTPESEFKRVVRHEVGHCLAGDTLIDCPRDLVKHPLGIPIKDLVGKTPWVYCWKDGKGTVRKASRVWLSKENVRTVRVKLKTGKGGNRNAKFLPPLELVGTPDHPVLLSDGVTWKNLGDLKSGDRLCSLYRDKNGDRSRIRWTGQDRIREHVFVCEQVYGERPEGYHAHHKDENKLNQCPDNLEWKEEFLHHSEHSTGHPVSEKARTLLAQRNRNRVWTEESKAKLSEFQQRRGEQLTDEERAALAEKASKQFKGKPQSAELVASRMEGMKKFYAAGGRSGMFGKTASAETKAKRSASMKATLARKRALTNHVVVSVEDAGCMDVYDMTVPDADSFVANGVVVHNSLGCPHEHMRREIVQRLDRAKTIAYFGRTQGWSPDEVMQQVLTPLEESSIMGTPDADETSIMAYSLPASITTDGRPIVGGSDFTATDRAFAAQAYPKAAVPEPVKPPTKPPTKPGGFVNELLEKLLLDAIQSLVTKFRFYAAGTETPYDDYAALILDEIVKALIAKRASGQMSKEDALAVLDQVKATLA